MTYKIKKCILQLLKIKFPVFVFLSNHNLVLFNLVFFSLPQVYYKNIVFEGTKRNILMRKNIFRGGSLRVYTLLENATDDAIA